MINFTKLFFEDHLTPSSGVASQRDPTTGTNGGSRTPGSATREATGHSGIGMDFAKGWTPVGMDVLDSL